MHHNVINLKKAFVEKQDKKIIKLTSENHKFKFKAKNQEERDYWF